MLEPHKSASITRSGVSAISDCYPVLPPNIFSRERFVDLAHYRSWLGLGRGEDGMAVLVTLWCGTCALGAGYRLPPVAVSDDLSIQVRTPSIIAVQPMVKEWLRQTLGDRMGMLRVPHSLQEHRALVDRDVAYSW